MAKTDRVDRDDDRAESRAATSAGHEGVSPDGLDLEFDGGHMSSYRTTLDRGLLNLIAQERGFNQVQFRVMENAIADWPRSFEGRETRIKFASDSPGVAQPERILGGLKLLDANGELYQRVPIRFSNNGGNEFVRNGHRVTMKHFRNYSGGQN